MGNAHELKYVLCAAVVSTKAGPSNGKEVYDESDWNGDSTLTDGSYMYSKVSNTTICRVLYAGVAL